MMVVTAIAQRSARVASVRALSTSAVARKDLVQEIYLRELKAYKPPEKTGKEHEGAVRNFQAPPKPQAPEFPSASQLSSELEAYASAEPDAPVAQASSADEEAAVDKQDVNEYLKELQADVKVEAHH